MLCYAPMPVGPEHCQRELGLELDLDLHAKHSKSRLSLSFHVMKMGIQEVSETFC